MKILIEVHHPAHVHFFKNPVRIWQSHGHEILILGRDRGVIPLLLQVYNLPYEIISKQSLGRFPLNELFKRNMALARKIKSFKPDVVLSLMGVYTQAAKIKGIRNIIFTDSEFQNLAHLIAHPFASYIVTPACFYKSLGPKQVRYNGYHELSYLAPKYFKADETKLKIEGLNKTDDFFILRLSAWDTWHDVKQRGIGQKVCLELINLLGKNGRVLISAEGEAPADLKKYLVKSPPQDLHHLLAFAKLVISEGATIASEAAVLGVPSIFINTTDRGYINELASRYQLAFYFKTPDGLIDQVTKLLENNNLQQEWQIKRNQMLGEKEDVVEFVVKFIENLN